MTRYEYALARAINDFHGEHGRPDQWSRDEREYYPRYVSARVEKLLAAADVTDPASMARSGGVR